MNTVCILGGSGFIGTRLAYRLTRQTQFVTKIFDKVSSRSFPGLTITGDVRSVQQILDAVPQGSIIINLIAEHHDDVLPVSLYDEVNVDGARNVCAVARERGVRTIIFTSSVAVYGFARIGIDESGAIAPFNDYGRTKYEAEQIYRAWQAEAPEDRALVIVRPTVVFGEQNRGNVYTLLRHIATGKFVMVGSGENRKSIAYVENVAAFLEYSMSFKPGVHIYNFADKPDFTMNGLVSCVSRMLGRPAKVRFKIPYTAGLFTAKTFDLLSFLTGTRFSISSIRIRKFCANSVYSTSIDSTGFESPIPLEHALEKTVRYEFLESHLEDDVFYTG